MLFENVLDVYPKQKTINKINIYWILLSTVIVIGIWYFLHSFCYSWRHGYLLQGCNQA